MKKIAAALVLAGITGSATVAVNVEGAPALYGTLPTAAGTILTR